MYQLCCILSKFYIKPQHERPPSVEISGCILSKFYIKPQRACGRLVFGDCCILSKFYIKPQQCPPSVEISAVVSYRNSTSNHNHFIPVFSQKSVVSYRNSTSNHNGVEFFDNTIVLYLIEILHQTTTITRFVLLFESCILSKFYIKPQQERHTPVRFWVVSYRNSTSNHNFTALFAFSISVVSYRNSTSNHNEPKPTSRQFIVVSYRNSTSNHNTASIISSQLRVVSYRNSTSNHNRPNIRRKVSTLYLIEILHQTTTDDVPNRP